MKWFVNLLLLCGALTAPAMIGAAAQAPAHVAGTWNVTVRKPGGTVHEQWMIQQKGTVVTGTAKAKQGDLPISGTIQGAFLRVSVKDGDKEYKVRATVDGASMDGSIAFGVGNEDLLFAERAGSGKTAAKK
jgi:2-keto-4-pentenoate hydratase/2-oxohepta-3-ene-1,7-dioic acid hydratase in catechol pathway